MSPLMMPSGKPLVLRGSLVVFRRKCGKPACRCSQGQLHEGPALSCSMAGKTQVLTLRDEDVPEVTAALERYRASAQVLEEDAVEGIALLRECAPAKKGAPLQPVRGALVEVGQGALAAALRLIPDPRREHLRVHELVALLQLGVVAMLCGVRSLYAIAQWAGERLADRPGLLELLGFVAGRAPSVPTVHRVFSRLDPFLLDQAIGLWARGGLQLGETLAMDGKMLRGTGGWNVAAVFLVAVCAVRARAVVAQMRCADAEGELTTGRKLLRVLPLRGNLLMADALHTQRDVCAYIVAQGGDYFLRAKLNQQDLMFAIARAFLGLELVDPGEGRRREVPERVQRELARRGAAITSALQAPSKAAHGRRERRELWALQDPELNAYIGSAGEVGGPWPHLRQVCWFERQRTVKGQVQTEVGYAITSLGAERADAGRLLDEQRGYWGAIENGLHWVRDVTLGEDDSQVRTAAAPQVMSSLRNLELTLLGACGCDNVAAAMRTYAANPERAVRLVMGMPSE